jgi:nucleotide-binding universal stress UspA family protein
MLGHVLVPLDGSLLAEVAIESAKQILVPKGRITLITAVEVPEHWEFGMAPVLIFPEHRNTIDQLLLRAKDYLEEIAAHLRAEGFQVETVAQFGDAAELIIDTASVREVDAISIATHGRSGFSRLLFGSVTGKVLSAAACPVFVTPSNPFSLKAVEAVTELDER